MRKFVVWLLAITMIAGNMTACGSKDNTTEPAPTGQQPTVTVPPETEAYQTEPLNTETTDVRIGHEDTYWIAETYISEDGHGAEGPYPLEQEYWFIDLLIRVDGTARFRDVHETVCLMDDSHQNLTWERTADGHFLFYSAIHVVPVLDAVYNNGILTLEYMGMTVTMKEAALPVGNDCIPAELAGTWIMVSTEVEGDQWEAMPYQLSSLVFYVTSGGESLILAADMEERDYYGWLSDCRYGQVSEIIPLPIYDGCGNDAWSVRVGALSEYDEKGYPLETEYYVTLLDYNTLLMQRYYTMDGYPAVSHQIYARFPDLVSWRMPEYMGLDLSNWVCVSYCGLSGEELPMPAELEDMTICLDEDQVCYIQYGDETVAEGVWQLEHGGVLLLRSLDDAEDPFWFGGAVSGYCIVTDDDVLDTYQMSLYYNGGIMKLVLGSYG